MTILLTATALAVAMLVGPLAVIVIGIHRQERAGLAARPAGAPRSPARCLRCTPPSQADRRHAAKPQPPRPTATRHRPGRPPSRAEPGHEHDEHRLAHRR